MANLDITLRDSFGSKLGVIAATAGSAIGLGNIWRFPYVAGENGGAAFLLVYIVFILAIGIPVMISEFVIGRNAQRNPYGAFRFLKPKAKWHLVGLMFIVTAFMILAFYSTVAGWTMEYLYSSLLNQFKGEDAAALTNTFEAFRTSGYQPAFWQLIFMFLTAGIVIAGVQKGIEKYSKILMPMLLVLLLALCVRALTLPGAGDGLRFLFAPDFSKITGKVILEALGQSFFSLSIGMGTLITYGSYIHKKEKLGNTAVAVSAADTLIAILAGVAIFPAVFAFHIEPASGPGLVFITLPNIFNQMPAGYFFAILFFLLLIIAALTSSISVLEVVVAFFSEEFNISRKKATFWAAFGIAVLGFVCTMSQGPWDKVQLFGQNLFDILDFTSANILLPVGGLFIVLFVGWFLGKSALKDELSNKGTVRVVFYGAYLFIIRFIAPIAIAFVFLNGLGLLG